MGRMNYQLQKPNLEQTVIFLHIHKTGGRTLEDILKKQYDPQKILSTDNLKWRQSHETLSQYSPAELENIKLIKGHMYFGIHNILLQPFTYITILRDPIERVLSLYCYIRDEPKNPQHKELIEKGMNLEQFLCSGIAKTAENGQTRILSGIQAENKPCSDEMFKLAKENLSKYFSVVGLTEQFDETLILLKRLLGYNIPIYSTKNKNKRRLSIDDISAKERKMIEQYNSFDLQLYEYAYQLFEEQKKQQGYLFNLEYTYFKSKSLVKKYFINSGK
ncbi:unknown [Crocosphaera subtropica ATCC 51142]|uniref:Sulfotransferase family protein n=2 Tax=Crocosphaera TaxID=263510 RepID=B1WVB4_CROS5|nr:unknown [Crocosphaera subtropica ATCC 51142]